MERVMAGPVARGMTRDAESRKLVITRLVRVIRNNVDARVKHGHDDLVCVPKRLRHGRAPLGPLCRASRQSGPAIHVYRCSQSVDAPNKSGHDDWRAPQWTRARINRHFFSCLVARLPLVFQSVILFRVKILRFYEKNSKKACDTCDRYGIYFSQNREPCAPLQLFELQPPFSAAFSRRVQARREDTEAVRQPDPSPWSCPAQAALRPRRPEGRGGSPSIPWKRGEGEGVRPSPGGHLPLRIGPRIG